MLSVLSRHLYRQAELDLQAFPNGVWEQVKMFQVFRRKWKIDIKL